MVTHPYHKCTRTHNSFFKFTICVGKAKIMAYTQSSWTVTLLVTLGHPTDNIVESITSPLANV